MRGGRHVKLTLDTAPSNNPGTDRTHSARTLSHVPSLPSWCAALVCSPKAYIYIYISYVEAASHHRETTEVSSSVGEP